MEENFLSLEIQKGKLYLNNLELKGVAKYKIELSSAFPGPEKAELNLTLLVNFSDNKQERHP